MGRAGRGVNHARISDAASPKYLSRDELVSFYATSMSTISAVHCTWDVSLNIPIHGLTIDDRNTQ